MLLGEIYMKGNPFRIESTIHALNRMSQRHISSMVVKSLLINLGERLLAYNNTGKELAIIDEINNVTVILQIRLFKAVIITVINRKKIRIKEGTIIEYIAS